MKDEIVEIVRMMSDDEAKRLIVQLLKEHCRKQEDFILTKADVPKPLKPFPLRIPEAWISRITDFVKQSDYYKTPAEFVREAIYKWMTERGI